ncbi:MAG: lipid-binding SYLF domain-containing protein [Desulfovibrionaceae bacterium]
MPTPLVPRRIPCAALLARVLLALALLAAGCAAARPAAAPPAPHQAIARDAARALADMTAQGRFAPLRDTLATARGVMIFPTVAKAGWIFGATGGAGVLLARDESGFWSAPAYYAMGDASLGVQFGLRRAAVVLVFATPASLDHAMRGRLDFGAAVEAAAWDWDTRDEASARAASTDPLCFIDVDGFFAGTALRLGGIMPRHDVNEAAYGPGATPEAILTARTLGRPASTLAEALGQEPDNTPPEAGVTPSGGQPQAAPQAAQ